MQKLDLIFSCLECEGLTDLKTIETIHIKGSMYEGHFLYDNIQLQPTFFT